MIILSCYFICLVGSNFWDKEETDLLWDLCERFSLKFPIIQDRFNWEMKGKRGSSYESKTVEEIKERYFTINSKLTGDKFIYDKSTDQKRRMILESYNARPIDQSMEEAFIVDYLSKLQNNGELESRLSERIETIKMLAGEQFTAGWPTLPELLKIASGKGVARLTDKKAKKGKKKRNRKPTQSQSSQPTSDLTAKPVSTATTKTTTSPSVKKVKTSSSLSTGIHSAGIIYLMSNRLHPLRVGSARAVEKILSDLNLPSKPELPTPAVIKKFDQIRAAIIKLIDARKAAGLPPSKSLESQENVSKNK